MPEAQEYDERGHLTYEGMRAVHARGRSVLHRGVLYEPGSKLPDLASVENVSPQRAAVAAATVRQQIEALNAQLIQLEAGHHTPSSVRSIPTVEVAAPVTESPEAPEGAPAAPTRDEPAEKGARARKP